jgi:uncharacterized protein (TIGR02391 family)
VDVTQTTTVPAELPRPVGVEGQRVLDMIWKHFVVHLAWPTYADIDRRMWAQGMEWEKTITQLCPALLRGISTQRSMTIQDSQELQLTLAGVANCVATNAVINVFLTMVRTAATIEPHFRPNENQSQPVLLEADLLSAPGINTETRKLLYSAAVLARQEPGFRGVSTRLDHLFWSLTFDRAIRPFAEVTDLADYWVRRERVLGPERTHYERRPFYALPADSELPTALLPHQVAGVPPVGVQETPARMEITSVIHPLIADVASDRFGRGFYNDAVRSAFQAVEHRVQNLAGSDQIGEKLMGIAFGKPPKITVTRSTGGSLESEQNGMQFLFKGAMGALRNPRMHGPDKKDDRDEAEELLVFASFLMRRLDIEDQSRQEP